MLSFVDLLVLIFTFVVAVSIQDYYRYDIIFIIITTTTTIIIIIIVVV